MKKGGYIMTKLPKPVTEPTMIHIPELGSEYTNYLLPIGARDFSKDNYKLLHHPDLHMNLDAADDLIGKKFGELSVLKVIGDIIYTTSRGRSRCYLCKCSCGSIKIIRDGSLKQGLTRSCGCKGVSDAHWKSSKIFFVWQNMLSACYRKSNPAYPYTGALGIRVCSEWDSPLTGKSADSYKAFLAFKEWAYNHGFEEIATLSTDQINLSRRNITQDYSPENCVFLSNIDINRNTHRSRWVTAFGHTFPLVVWCEIIHMPISTIFNRLDQGWPAEDALATPRYKRPIDGYPAPIIPDQYLKYEKPESEKDGDTLC